MTRNAQENSAVNQTCVADPYEYSVNSSVGMSYTCVSLLSMRGSRGEQLAFRLTVRATERIQLLQMKNNHPA